MEMSYVRSIVDHLTTEDDEEHEEELNIADVSADKIRAVLNSRSEHQGNHYLIARQRVEDIGRC